MVGAPPLGPPPLFVFVFYSPLSAQTVTSFAPVWNFPWALIFVDAGSMVLVSFVPLFPMKLVFFSTIFNSLSTLFSRPPLCFPAPGVLD